MHAVFEMPFELVFVFPQLCLTLFLNKGIESGAESSIQRWLAVYQKPIFFGFYKLNDDWSDTPTDAALYLELSKLCDLQVKEESSTNGE